MRGVHRGVNRPAPRCRSALSATCVLATDLHLFMDCPPQERANPRFAHPAAAMLAAEPGVSRARAPPRIRSWTTAQFQPYPQPSPAPATLRPLLCPENMLDADPNGRTGLPRAPQRLVAAGCEDPALNPFSFSTVSISPSGAAIPKARYPEPYCHTSPRRFRRTSLCRRSTMVFVA